MTGFCRKTICLFIAMLFIFSLSIPAFAVSGRTTVYRTKTGDHYHTSDCRFLGKSKIKTTLDAAVNEYHLTPCSICNPPSFESEAEIAAEPVEPDLNKTTRPANGEVLYSKNKTRPSTLTFENNTNYDCLVTMVNGSNTEVLQFYVRKNKDATVDIPTGKLFLQIAYGSTWKNPTELFGKNTNYESGDGELDVGKGEDWTFTFG
ncbi:MAG: hypothetical protein IJK38_03000 [Oscillospiraceae bacterium]|nr:hypothetical protein [Oscillospiraceae bacterium]